MSVAQKRSSDLAFQKNLAFGQMAETAIARWLISRGAIVLPIYDIEYDTGKGPRLFSADMKLVAPDLLVWNKRQFLWIEAKHKSVFTWSRRHGHWQTGIDLKHWRDYQKVSQRTGCDIWLLFLHRCSRPDFRDREYCPPECPTGLFGGTIERLTETFSHEDMRHGRSGMIYWNHKSLHAIASLKEFTA